ncbi:MAG: LCP family protein [Tissierellia bacterium]|nr:LCP family protein [Tissierellia bacterium]
MRSKKNGRKMSKSNKKKGIIAFILASIVFSVFFYGLYLLGKINYIPIDEENLGLSEEAPEDKKVTNILLFGLDNRVEGQRSRSDTIMIATLDSRENKIKLTSLMRDTYVSIPGREDNRINAAYAFGGPELAIRTVNENYNMNIEKYVTVDFFSLEKVIDLLGGVEIEVKDYEVSSLNSGIKYLNNLYKDDTDSPIIDSPGKYTLDGRQAVAYARIRKAGNGDFERTDRQRTVLKALIEKGASINPLEAHSLLSTILPEVETNLSKGEILKLGLAGLKSAKNPVEDLRLPYEGTYQHQKIRGMAVLVPNMEKNRQILHDFIFGS